jgi:hypothetical protein
MSATPAPVQLSFFCPCGRRLVELPRRGICRLCYYGRYHSRRFFAGQRERVLARDRRCVVCGAVEGLTVHHRRRGTRDPGSLVTVCAACHARIHRSLRLKTWIPERLLELWAEAHPASCVQLQFTLTAG